MTRRAWLSVRLVLPFIDALACGFEGEAAERGGKKAVVTGNPVRQEITKIDPPSERFAGRGGRLRLLVFGGSLGARFLNHLLPKAISLLPSDSRPEIIHQCGFKAVDEVKALYAEAGVEACGAALSLKTWRQPIRGLTLCSAAPARRVCLKSAQRALLLFLCRSL